MHGSSGIIKNFGTNRVIGLLILPLVCTGSHREFPSHGRFFTDGRFPSCMFCQTRVILFMGNVHDLTHSVFYVVHDCGCIPYPSRGRKHPRYGLGRLDPRCIPYPSRGRKPAFAEIGEYSAGCIPYPSRGRKRLCANSMLYCSQDASPTPHGDGNLRNNNNITSMLGCIPYPSRGRKLHNHAT